MPLSLLLVLYGFQYPTGGNQSEEEKSSMTFAVISFLTGHSATSCLIIVLVVSLDNFRCKMSLGVFLIKKYECYGTTYNKEP